MNLYIDPGTGSMLFTIILGAVSVFIFFARSIFIKLKVFFSGDKSRTHDKNSLPYVIFSDDKRYWTTFEPICDEFEKRGETVYYYTASEDDPALKKEYEHVHTEFIGTGMKPFSRLNMLRADIVLSTTPSLDVFQWKRSRDVKWYAHIYHAVGGGSFYRMFGIDYYDALLMSGPVFEKQIRELEKIRNLPEKEIKIVGLPYLDQLYNRKHGDNNTEIDCDTKTILWAPTWGKNGALRKYGEDFIEALISTGYHIIIRPHPQSLKSEKEFMDSIMDKYPNSEQLEWNTDHDNYDCLNRSDLLISDYSGVVFDYCFIFDKPFIYTSEDVSTDEYDAYWIDEEPWILQTYKKMGMPLGEDWKDNLKECIDSTMNNTSFAKACETAKQEGWNHIGESAKCTVDYLTAKREELVKPVDEEQQSEDNDK